VTLPEPPDPTLVPRDLLPLPKPYSPPRNDTERRIEEIWRTTLSMDCVGIDDDYQDLGGDSLQAAAIFLGIQAEFGIDVPMATLAKAPTIAELALLIDQRLVGE